LLPLKTEADTVEDLERVLEKLVDNPDLIRQLGAAASIKAGSAYTWEKKADVLAAVMSYAMGVGPRIPLTPRKELLSQYDSVAVQ
jgi:hypothetical protein